MKIGDKFNDWTVIDDKSINRNGATMYLCRCKCGKEQYVQSSGLKLGKSKMCKECSNLAKRAKVDIGKKYKFYTVISGPHRRNSQLVYLVRCECGNEHYMPASQILDPNKYFKCRRCTSGNIISGFREGFLNTFKRSAESRGIFYSEDLTPEYLYKLLESQNFRCALSGYKLLPNDTLDDIKQNLNLSLDRIDSNKGYEVGNVQWVTKYVNWAKNDLSQEDFINLCIAVANKHANQQPSQPLKKLEGSETNS